MKPILIITFCFLTITGFGKKSSNIIYVDGNNNEFVITKDSLIYNPIQENESSSGEYSGGQKKTIAINDELFAEIQKLIQVTIDDKSSHIKTRNMGCGTLIVKTKTYFIEMNSENKKNLENYLRKLLEIN